MPGKRRKKTPGIGKQTHLMRGLHIIAESGAKYLLVGGIAENLHGLARTTKDIDLLIPKDLANTEKLLRALDNLMWGWSREIDAEEVVNKVFTIIGDSPRVDLLLRAGRLTFEEGYPNRITKQVDGMHLCYVSLDDLIRSKQTSRPADAITITELQKLKQLKKR